MKRIFLSVIISLLGMILCFPLGVLVAENMNASQPSGEMETKTYEWDDKLKRGSLNIISSPVEIARQIQITSEAESLASGWTVGLVQGFGRGLERLGTGTIDLLTFPFNFPDERKAPLVQPEYVWQKSGVKYS